MPLIDCTILSHKFNIEYLVKGRDILTNMTKYHIWISEDEEQDFLQDENKRFNMILDRTNIIFDDKVLISLHNSVKHLIGDYN
jgi:hypothetical protein